MLITKALSLAACLLQTVQCLPLSQATLLLGQPQSPVHPGWLAGLAKFLPFQLGDYFKEDSSRLSFNVTDGVKSLCLTQDDDFERWLQLQSDISFLSILQNIGGFGIQDPEVAKGAVIASPSRIKPNYYYQWTRDAALTINSLVDYLEDAGLEGSPFNLTGVIEAYIANSYRLQRQSNPSGVFEDLSGLGEPKFLPNSSAFLEHWGRPQRDGPGLRVITIAHYLDVLHKHSFNVSDPAMPEKEFVYEQVLKPDLQYVAKYWSSTGFDLWEEVDSLHLFTSLTQLKALKVGIQLARRYDDDAFGSQLALAFNALRYFIQIGSGYKPSDYAYLIETPSLVVQGRRSGLDIASLLASLRAHDVNDIEDSVLIPFAVTDSAVMGTLTVMANDMKYRYPINHQRVGLASGFALGRYPEDVYDGIGMSEGNPWFISTATAAELVYQMVYSLYYTQVDLVIPRDQFALYQSLTTLSPDPRAASVTLPYNSEAFNTTAYALMSYADTFLAIIKDHVDGSGHMSEQFNRYTGYMEGAQSLTWSYSPFWSAVRWRHKATALLPEQ